MTVKITEQACLRFAQMRETQRGNPRIEIRAGGCNGFEKIFSWTDTINEDDVEMSTSSGPIIIDSISFQLLENATVDYRTDIAGAYFVIEIPEATSTCGCGTSFSL